MKIPVFLGFMILFLLFIGGLYVLWGDKYREPEVKTVNNQTMMACDKDYNLVQDQGNISKLTCFKEGTAMRAKMTFLHYLTATLIISAFMMFLAEYMRRDLSSKIGYYKNTFSDDTLLNRCPDLYTSKGFLWTFEGYDRIVTQTEQKMHISRMDMVTTVGKNILFKGEAAKITPRQLYDYLGKNKRLFYEIMHETVENFDVKAVLDDAPQIFVPIPMGNAEKEAFYTLRGNYGFDSDRFSYIINLMFKIRNGTGSLDNEMHKSITSMMKHGEDFVSSISRMGREADQTKRTKTAEQVKTDQSYYNSGNERVRP